MPYTNDSNALQQALNLLSRTQSILDSQRGEDSESHKTPLQSDIENFIYKQSQPNDTFYTEGLY